MGIGLIFGEGNVLFLSAFLGFGVDDVSGLEGYMVVGVIGECCASVLPGVCWAYVTCERLLRPQKLESATLFFRLV